MQLVDSIAERDLTARVPSGIAVKFYKRMFKNEARSKDEGRPIYDEKIFIEKVFVGARDVVDVPANERDFDTFPREYAAFLRSETGDPAKEGTPLTVVPWLERTRIAEFNSLHVDTVEELAALSHEKAMKFGISTKKDVEQAKAYLAAAKDGSVIAKAVGDADELRAQLQAARDEIKELKDALREANSKKK